MSHSSLRVLAYHRVVEADRISVLNPSLVSASPADFEQQMQHLAKRYRVLGLQEVLDAQRGRRALPRRAVLLTFDDAYRDFGEVAWPILQRYRLPASLCVPTAYPDQPEREFWWDRVHRAIASTTRKAIVLPLLGILQFDTQEARLTSLRTVQRLCKSIPHARAMKLVDQLCSGLRVHGSGASDVLSWDELRELAGEGISLIPHTRSHPALTQLDPDAIAAEVRGSIEDLDREIGTSLPVFCYPFGLYDDRAVDELRKQDVELAFTCLDGHNRLPSGDPLRLRRTVITRRTSPLIFKLRLRKSVSYLDVWRHRPKRGDTRLRDRTQDGASGASVRDPAVKIAHIMSRFPKLSETFVLNEILTLEAMGVAVELYPLIRERQSVSHPEVENWVRRAHFQPFLSRSICRAQAHFLRHQPGTYLRVLWEVLQKTWGSRNFFLGALGIFPKSVRFAYEMKAKGITHIHAHFATHPAVSALIVHRLTGIPFSFTAHGSDLHVERRMLDTKVEAAAFAVTVSNFNKEIMVSACGEHMRRKIHVIHCGVDPSFFSPARAQRDEARFEIVCIASLEEVKGHRFLIEACRILQDRGITFRCHFVGDGPLRLRLETQIVRAGMNDRIWLYGGKPREEVAKLISAMDVAVLASHPTSKGKREGIPVALMEAMACGIPVVASNLTGIPELVEHETTGLLVPSGDPLSLADALERLSIDRELREHMGRKGRLKVMREFDLEVNTRELLNMITGTHRVDSQARAQSSRSPRAADRFTGEAEIRSLLARQQPSVAPVLPSVPIASGLRIHDTTPSD